MKVQFDRREYTLKHEAYATNYRDGIRYAAAATDERGRKFLIEWETTPEWDELQRSFREACKAALCENGSF